ncbi:MAG: toll/interleukin-1 receptor domain-containing protein [Acidobacteriota bacterium]
MPYDLFISYSRRDNEQKRITEFVERISRDFESFSGRPLRPFFDVTDIQGMDDWRHRILQGLRESRLMLACISPDYLQSEYCEWEFNEYVKNEVARALVGEGVAPIYFVEVPGWQDKDFDRRSAEWVAELRRRQHFDLRPWFHEGEEALREVEVQRRLAKLNQRIAERIQRGERAEQRLGNVDAHNAHFTGRTEELRRLRETVALKKIGVLTAVHGLGGMGKTALANEYAHAFAHDYGGGRWQVRCEGREDLVVAITTLGPALGVEFTDAEKIDTELQWERVLTELRRLADAREPHRCLLILDNVDRPALLEPAQTQRLPAADWLHVIATTRLGENDLFARHQDRAFLAVDEMPEADALDLIETYQPAGRFARNYKGEDAVEREAAQGIVRLLGCFTLAIETAAVFLGQFADDVTCASFLERLKREGLEGLESAASQTTEGVRHGEKRLTATLQPTLERLSEHEKLALSYAALLPADQIALPWIRALVAEQFPELGQDAAPGHPDPWQNLLRRLFSLRLLKATGVVDDDSQPLVARMHRLLQELMQRAGDHAGTLEPALFAQVKTRADFLWEGWVRHEHRWELRPVVAFAWQLMERGRPLGIYVANQACGPLHHLGSFAEAEALVRRALEIDERSFGPYHRGVATALNNLAQLLQATKRLSEAEPLMRRALEIDKRTFGPDHPVVARDLNNLAQLLQATNRLPEAEPLMRRALELDEQSSGPEHPVVARDLNNLALFLQATNRFADAEPLMRRALEIDEQTCGPDHPVVARDLNNLALLLQDTNRLAEAEPLIRRALEIDEQSFGADHPDVAIDLNNLAQLLQGTNRLPEAEPLMRRALQIDEQNFGPDHPVGARGLNNLAQLLQATNRLREAEPLMRRALQIDEKCFGPDHPDVATDLNNLATLLQTTNRMPEAESLMCRVVEIFEKSLGKDHPNVASALNNLAQLLQATNRLAEAEPLMRRALEIDERSFGPDHPDVATDLNNLALLLKDTNRLAEAEPPMKRALAIDELSFGPDHPTVAIRLNNLASLLKDTNRLAEAEPLMRRALEIDEQSLGADHPDVARDLNNLALLLQATNRLAEAESFMRRAADIDEQSFGPDHPKIGIRLNNLALLLTATNRLLEAEPLMRRSLAIDEHSFGPDNPTVAIRLNNLALLLTATNRLAEAEPLMRRDLEILSRFTIATGHEHPHLQSAIANYTALLRQMGHTEEQVKAELDKVGGPFDIRPGSDT